MIAQRTRKRRLRLSVEIVRGKKVVDRIELPDPREGFVASLNKTAKEVRSELTARYARQASRAAKGGA